MIDKAYLRMMARYNRWQNDAIFAAADPLGDDQRREGRGAFWTSIHGTLSHLYWADRLWMSRLGVAEAPNAPMKDSPTFVDDWRDLTTQRRELDQAIVAWADDFAEGPVVGELTWFSGVMGREVRAPLGVLLPHIFNHQTHHRGQAHALITAEGGVTSDTDLFLMPGELWPADWPRPVG